MGALGSIWHFLYKICGMSTIVGLFAPVNESVFEHLKLVFWPPILYFFVLYLIKRTAPKNSIVSLLMGIIAGMLTTVVLFYTYNGVTGKNIDFINIIIYFIALAVLIIVRNLFIKNGFLNGKKAKWIAILGYVIIAVLLVVFTFYPPSIPLFVSPD